MFILMHIKINILKTLTINIQINSFKSNLSFFLYYQKSMTDIILNQLVKQQ